LPLDCESADKRSVSNIVEHPVARTFEPENRMKISA
jgi:hypothetical protein